MLCLFLSYDHRAFESFVLFEVLTQLNIWHHSRERSTFVIIQMSEDLVKQLSSYKAQLAQVEVALSTDQENEDLLKLQKDLQVRGNEKLCVETAHNFQAISQCFGCRKAGQAVHFPFDMYFIQLSNLTYFFVNNLTRHVTAQKIITFMTTFGDKSDFWPRIIK